MKIALYQMRIQWEDKEYNYQKLGEKLGEVSKNGVELILLPEMSFTGFSMNIATTKETNQETIQRVRELCKKYQIGIGFGWVKAAGEKAENHYTIVDEAGEIQLDYTKLHPFHMANEDRFFVKGDHISTVTYHGMNLATFICYDLRFPTIFQALGDETKVVVVAANWPEKRRDHWRSLLKARAIENQVYIVGVNCVGEMGELTYSGDSCIISPNGEVLEELTGEEGILYADITEQVDKIRKSFPVRQDRRTELYQELLSNMSKRI